MNNKRYIILISFFLVLANLSLSAYNNTRTRLYFETKHGYKTEKLVFGIDKNATSSLDTALGEFEAPPFAPPQGEGINSGFIIYDTSQEAFIWTYLDLRPYPESDTSWVYYKILSLIGSGDVITIKWPDFGGKIDSAYIVDYATMGLICNVNMKNTTSVTMPNEFVNEFVLRVKYPTATNVIEEQINQKFETCVFPNPASDFVLIDSPEIIESVKIIDIYGITREIKGINSNTYRLEIGYLASSNYTLIIKHKNATSIIRQLIKVQ